MKDGKIEQSGIIEVDSGTCLSGNEAAKVWQRLSDRIAHFEGMRCMIRNPADPLSKSERELYEQLTNYLTVVSSIAKIATSENPR